MGNLFAALLAGVLAKPISKADSWMRRQTAGTVRGTAEATADAPLLAEIDQVASDQAGAAAMDAVAAKGGNLAAVAEIVNAAP